MQTLSSQKLDFFIACKGDGFSTLHIFLTFIHYESITSMTLFLLLWFRAILFRLGGICDDAYLGCKNQLRHSPSMGNSLMYPLDRSKPAKFPLQILLCSIIAQSRHEKRFECISPHIRIIARFY